MKKLLMAWMLGLVSITMMGQDVLRIGDKYYVGDDMMNKQVFATYMQQKAEQNLSHQFASGLKLSNVGWGLFAGGLATQIVGSALYGVYVMPYMNINYKTEQPSVQVNIPAGSQPGATASTVLYVLGSASTLSGIICLGVGYGRMHHAADFFAYNNNRPKDQAYFTIQSSASGLGLALHF